MATLEKRWVCKNRLVCRIIAHRQEVDKFTSAHLPELSASNVHYVYSVYSSPPFHSQSRHRDQGKLSAYVHATAKKCKF